MTDLQILLIKDLLVKHEVKEYFEYVPIDCYEGESLLSVVESITCAIVDNVFNTVKLLDGYDRVVSLGTLEDEIEVMVKLELMDYMVVTERTF